MNTKIILFALLLATGSATGFAQQWVNQPTPTGQTLNDIFFSDPDNGYAVGYYGTILKTNNAGNSWISLANNFTDELQASYFFNPDTGFVAGFEGLFRTNDGGISWTQVILPDTQQMYHVEFISSQVGFATGHGTSIYKTTNRGLSWQKKNVDTILWNAVVDISFPTPDTGYAVMKGYNTKYIKTVDGGENWTVTEVLPFCPLSNIEGVHFINPSKGFISGWYIGAFLQTADGGSSWADQPVSGTTQGNYYDIDFFSSSHGLTVGYGGEVLTTTDGGTTWAAETVGGTGNAWYSVFHDESGNAYIAGGNGLIYKRSALSSVNEEVFSFNAMIFPNPAEYDLTILFPDTYTDVTVSVFNSLGETLMVQTTNQTSKIQIKLTGAPGIYFVKLQSGTITETRVVVKR